MSVEIANLVDFMVSFTAANPPVLIARTDNVVGVTRSGAGQYVVELQNKIPIGGLPAAGRQLQSTSKSAAAATFCAAIEDGTGDVLVEARNLAGALADTAARLDVVCLTYPTAT